MMLTWTSSRMFLKRTYPRFAPPKFATLTFPGITNSLLGIGMVSGRSSNNRWRYDIWPSKLCICSRIWSSLFKRNFDCQWGIKDHTKTGSNNSNDQKTMWQEAPLIKAAKKRSAVPFDEVSSVYLILQSYAEKQKLSTSLQMKKPNCAAINSIRTFSKM